MQVDTLGRLWQYALKHFGPDFDPADVDYERTEGLIRALRNKGLRGQSISRVAQCLKRGLKIAARRKWVDKLPIDWPRIKSDPPKRSQAGKWVPLEVLRDWLAVMDPLARLHAAGVAQTGLREEEMRRGDPDWLVEAPPGVDAAAFVELPGDSTKTRKMRPIPVDHETADMLLTYWAYPDRPKSHRTARRSATKAIGYGQNITLRDLRHVVATLAEKHDRKAAQDLLGHTTERMTQRYLHSDSERLAAAAEAVTAGLGLDRGHVLGGTNSARHEKVGGRRGFRTPDLVRVNQEAPNHYGNIRQISDGFRHEESTRSDTPGAQRGHKKRRARSR